MVDIQDRLPDQELSGRQVYIVGGGIAGLAAAALLIRDGGMPGECIHILEKSDQVGGSLDGAGDPQAGYIIRGGRMFEKYFVCTYDLFSTIPTLDDHGMSVTEEIQAFTRRVATSSNSRLVAAGQRLAAPALELTLRDKWDLLRLLLRQESSIGAMTIEGYFRREFFATNFWLMWCTMFAFEPWHSLVEFRRYMRRFMHLMPGVNRLQGIYRTPFNQFDSLVLPLTRWLQAQGVDLRTATTVTDVCFEESEQPSTVSGIAVEDPAGARHIALGEHDLVLVTLGSMTEASTVGTMESAPRWQASSDRGAWSLWQRIARRSPLFGRPDVFSDVGVLYRHPERPGVFRFHGTVYRKSGWYWRPGDVQGFQLVDVGGVSPSAPLPQPAARYPSVLGVRIVSRTPWQRSTQTDVGLQRERDPRGIAILPAHR